MFSTLVRCPFLLTETPATRHQDFEIGNLKPESLSLYESVQEYLSLLALEQA